MVKIKIKFPNNEYKANINFQFDIKVNIPSKKK